MQFGVLGPLLIRTNGRELSAGGPRSQRILAMLLVNANHVVTVTRLQDAAWDDAAPVTAHRQIRNRVATLRGLLTPLGAIIETHNLGYRLRMADDDLDALAFDRLVERARSSSESAEAVRLFRDALALWRGPALDGLTGGALAREAVALTERHLSALIDCLDLELAAGEHVRLIPDLRRYVADHPLHEGFVSRLMIALYRGGQQRAALDVYSELRRQLREELGVDPGAEAQQTHRAILDGGSGPRSPRLQVEQALVRGPQDPPPALPVPRQLPRDVTAFIGHADELAQLDSLLNAAGSGELMAIGAVHGAGGVGKSALVVHAAHRAAHMFPDGQLYVDLQGATAWVPPLSPVDVLGRFLRALGFPGWEIPVEVEDAAAQFRSAVAARRVLLVLDNARDAGQVAPLLPGAAGCAVLVASRRILVSLEGAQHLPLSVLSPDESIAQLAEIAGAERVRAEPADAARVARWCGYLPLALRIAGARLAARPGMPVAGFAARLADAQRRLDELELGDIGVRTSVTISHQELRDSDDSLDQAAARAFAMLGLLDGADIGLAAAARLLDRSVPATEQVLDRLVDVHLLESPAPDRYRLHDLLRLYAREKTATECAAGEQAVALARVFGFYLAAVWRASQLVRPGDHRLRLADPRWTAGGQDFADVSAALDWLEVERSNLVKAIRQAVETPGIPAQLPIQLALALYGFLRLRGYWRDAVEVNQIAIAVGVRTGDLGSEAAARTDLGAALSQLGRYAQAADAIEQALEILRTTGDRHLEAQALSNMGVIRHMMGRLDEALECYQQSLAIHEGLGNKRGQAMCLGNLGPIHRQQGRYELARDYHLRGLALFEELGDRYGQAVGLAELGVLYGQLGKSDDGESCLHESLAIYRQMGDRYGEAYALMGLGVIQRERGMPAAALALQHSALAMCRELGRRDGQAAGLRELGLTYRTLGRLAEARTSWQAACTLFEELQSADAQAVRDLLASLPAPAQ